MKQLFLFILLLATSCKGTESQKPLKDKGVIEAYEPKDSISFPHAIHNDQKIDCKYCHNPTTEKNKNELTKGICKDCHTSINGNNVRTKID
jgi:hypothetical protein